MEIYSVFYATRPKSFFMSRTDFESLAEADAFIASAFFAKNLFSFDFMLRDGKILVKGTPLHDSPEYFSSSMKFAVDISPADLGYNRLAENN